MKSFNWIYQSFKLNANDCWNRTTDQFLHSSYVCSIFAFVFYHAMETNSINTFLLDHFVESTVDCFNVPLLTLRYLLDVKWFAFESKKTFFWLLVKNLDQESEQQQLCNEVFFFNFKNVINRTRSHSIIHTRRKVNKNQL